MSNVNRVCSKSWFGKALSEVFSSGTALREPMSFANPKVEFSCDRTALSNDGGECCRTQSGAMRWDTTFLDYGIEARRLRPIGKAGNGLVLHSALAIEPQNGQSLGLLSQNCGIGSQRQSHHKMKPQRRKKKQRQAAARKSPNRPFEQKRIQVVEAMTTVESPHKSAYTSDSCFRPWRW